MLSGVELANELRQAVRFFWQTRSSQGLAQGAVSGSKDAGNRSMVTGGRHMDGFVVLFSRIIVEEGFPSTSIHLRETTLPGYFRPEKDWDLVVVHEGILVATVEFKSHIGPSFGNNFNNRVEEALGSATDLNTAFREGAFQPSTKPWLGYMMLLEEHPRSVSPVRLREPHFKALPEFQGSSYRSRYELFCTRLVRERLYDAACLLLSPAAAGVQGDFREPREELSFASFAASLQGRLVEVQRRKMNR